MAIPTAEPAISYTHCQTFGMAVRPVSTHSAATEEVNAMTKKERSQQPRPAARPRVDDLLHAIALAMARRQMELAWPAVQSDWI
jgi:hypothetical protein